MTDLSPRQAISSSANGGHSHSKDENNIFSPGTMLEHRWEIIRLIGKGNISVFQTRLACSIIVRILFRLIQ